MCGFLCREEAAVEVVGLWGCCYWWHCFWCCCRWYFSGNASRVCWNTMHSTAIPVGMYKVFRKLHFVHSESAVNTHYRSRPCQCRCCCCCLFCTLVLPSSIHGPSGWLCGFGASKTHCQCDECLVSSQLLLSSIKWPQQTVNAVTATNESFGIKCRTIAAITNTMATFCYRFQKRSRKCGNHKESNVAKTTHFSQNWTEAQQIWILQNALSDIEKPAKTSFVYSSDTCVCVRLFFGYKAVRFTTIDFIAFFHWITKLEAGF